MMLSDRGLRSAMRHGGLRIEPQPEDSCIQPCSIDLHLHNEFRTIKPGLLVLDPRNVGVHTVLHSATPDDGFPIQPGQFMLASTVERVTLASSLVGRIEGKSSLGRLGLQVHATAGFVDAGWTGQLTLELVNIAGLPILLYPGMHIAQLSVLQLTSPAERPYGHPALGSRYVGQTGPTGSKS